MIRNFKLPKFQNMADVKICFDKVSALLARSATLAKQDEYLSSNANMPVVLLMVKLSPKTVLLTKQKN